MQKEQNGICKLNTGEKYNNKPLGFSITMSKSGKLIVSELTCRENSGGRLYQLFLSIALLSLAVGISCHCPSSLSPSVLPTTYNSTHPNLP